MCLKYFFFLNDTIIVMTYACVSHVQSIGTACVRGTLHFLVNGDGFDSAVLCTQNFKNAKETLFCF